MEPGHDGGAMLTRLEVDRFTGLLDLSIDFGPFTCSAGGSGTGKPYVPDLRAAVEQL
ncbi:hypothetical protein ABZ467_03930 [Streptomyces sp. NPDC005727]|uniref:hypothetical protein n=1 Tax=Streptomyces sp. NPDC005727 TaxID=3157053 RepID=UPI0033C6E9CC